MVRYVIKRIIILIPVVIVISIILFAIGKFMPGDPVRAMLPTTLRPEQYDLAYDAMYLRLGLDKNIVIQYLSWFYNIIIRGELGFSTMGNRPVVDMITIPLTNTIILNMFVNIFYLLIALPLGIKIAVKRGGLLDNTVQIGSLATYSIPSFFLGLSLIFIFSVRLGWLPMGGMPNTFMLSTGENLIAWARILILPVTTLVIINIAGAIRYIRNAMIDALSQDYIRTARSKGLSEKIVIYSHAMRNAMIPISTVIVNVVFALFSGAAVTETVFAYNGIGRTLLMAVSRLDTMLIISMTLMFAGINVVAMLVADIIYGLVDPRVKLR